MANMGYCIFSNTLTDMQDCYDAMIERKELSKSERQAMLEMLDLCDLMREEFDRQRSEEMYVQMINNREVILEEIDNKFK